MCYVVQQQQRYFAINYNFVYRSHERAARNLVYFRVLLRHGASSPLRISWTSNCGQPTKDSPPAWQLDRGIQNIYCTKLARNGTLHGTADCCYVFVWKARTYNNYVWEQVLRRIFCLKREVVTQILIKVHNGEIYNFCTFHKILLAL